MTLRDFVQRSHTGKPPGPPFISFISLDKHFGEQAELVDFDCRTYSVTGRREYCHGARCGGNYTQIERPPRGREEVPVQISRLLNAHQVIIRETERWRAVLPNSETTAATIF